MPISFSFGSIREDSVAITIQLLRNLEIQVTENTVTEVLKGHPDYPSLLSISDSLKQWNIDNVCMQIGPDGLNELSAPFIAHLKTGYGELVTVTRITASEISYVSSGLGNKTVNKSLEAFLKEWSGIVLVAEPAGKSGEKEYAANRKKELFREGRLLLTAMTCLLMVCIYSIFIVHSYEFLALSLLKLSGTVITAFLLWNEIDEANPMLKKLCSAGKKANCKAVLQSKAARLFGGVTWSEIGFFYFAGGIISIILAVNRELTLYILSWLNLFALPYILFSIYYQWKIIRQWCVLCLSVQALLAIEFVVFYLAFWKHTILLNGVDASALFNLIIAYLIPVFFWSFTKTAVIKLQSGKQAEIELRRLKHDSRIFEALLARQKTLTSNPEGLGITLGNAYAANTLIKVCNPYCNPCAKSHPVIGDLLNENDNLKVQIVFMASDDEADHRAEPVKHLMALYERQDDRLMHEALDEWYLPENKDYREFANKYPLNGELQHQGHKLQAMEKWCREMKITFTPTFFLNGYQLPEMYTIADLKYFLSIQEDGEETFKSLYHVT